MDMSCPSRRKICRRTAVWRRRPARFGGSTAPSSFRECVGDDLKVKMAMSFPHTIRLNRGETVVFSRIAFKSRAHRDSVNARVMKDPRLVKMMDLKSMPFDSKRMVYGGFKVMVDA